MTYIPLGAFGAPWICDLVSDINVGKLRPYCFKCCSVLPLRPGVPVSVFAPFVVVTVLGYPVLFSPAGFPLWFSALVVSVAIASAQILSSAKSTSEPIRRLPSLPLCSSAFDH